MTKTKESKKRKVKKHLF